MPFFNGQLKQEFLSHVFSFFPQRTNESVAWGVVFATVRGAVWIFLKRGLLSFLLLRGMIFLFFAFLLLLRFRSSTGALFVVRCRGIFFFLSSVGFLRRQQNSHTFAHVQHVLELFDFALEYFSRLPKVYFTLSFGSLRAHTHTHTRY